MVYVRCNETLYDVDLVNIRCYSIDISINNIGGISNEID